MKSIKEKNLKELKSYALKSITIFIILTLISSIPIIGLFIGFPLAIYLVYIYILSYKSFNKYHNYKKSYLWVVPFMFANPITSLLVLNDKII
jgi:hypothetical protein